MMMRPLQVGFISLLSLSFVFAQEMTGGAMTGGDMTGGSVDAATVQVGENEELGQFLVDAEEMTLYLFTNDTENTSNCDEDCIQNWPPLLTEGEPTAGEGADAALLGTTERADGDTQVTYNGWPLYYFVNDEAAGDTTGQAAGEVWYVVSPQGEAVHTE